MQAKPRLSLLQPILQTQQYLQALLPLADLLMRLYLGKIFFMAGLSKMREWEMTIALFTDEYHVPLLAPDIAAYLATAAELSLPVLLVLGLFKQYAAFGLALVNILAVIAYYGALKDLPAALQDHLEWGLMLFLIASSSTNMLQIDHYFGRNKCACE